MDSAPAFQEKVAVDYKLDQDLPLPSATITDLCNEPLFFSGYMSEEEDISSESDSMSFSTDSIGDMHDDASSAKSSDDAEATFPEMLAEDCNFVEQQCSHAQAIRIVPAGRAKVIHVAKVTIPSSPITRFSSSSSRSSHSRADSHMTFMSSKYNISRKGSASSSYSTTSNGAQVHKSSGSPELPSTPRLETGLKTPQSVGSPATPRSGATLARESVTVIYKETLDAPYSTTRSNPFSMPSFKSKMIARAANERQSILELPPFPHQMTTSETKSPRSWMLRKDSFGSIHAKKNGIRRAESRVVLQRS
ncbi:hypothetical protein BT93_L5222 [Corymbia citriodora subsp. variegata]|uniref:Uncharacterized protein n=1 Tax=Corymbia citriodora subsp. variegata TaxID=360336 RepID=A0A8T0CJG7_CORYI|nr:hypothetical protein BT93_L5222 [Corymbia citriodora subsp. variegata]